MIRRKGFIVLYTWSVCLLTIFSCKENDVLEIEQYLDFKVYESNFQSVELAKNAYLINCLDDIIYMNLDGTFQWHLDKNAIYNQGDKENFIICQFLSDSNSSDLFVFGSVKNGEMGYVKLVIARISADSDIKWTQEFIITDEYESKPPRANEEFYLQENNYPISFIDSEHLYSAFSYDTKSGIRAKYMLLKIDKSGEVIANSSFDMGDFYGRIYALRVNSNSELVLSRGGRDWFALEIFDSNFNLLRSKRIDSFTDLAGNVINGFRDPILNTIIGFDDSDMIFTGHIDLINNRNTNFFSNFDYFVVRWNNDSLIFSTAGLNEYKELSFNSFITKNSSVKMVGVKRGLNELLHDIDSDMLSIDVSHSGAIQEIELLVDNQGLEAIFGVETPDQELTFLGKKTGFTNESLHSFLIKLPP